LLRIDRALRDRAAIRLAPDKSDPRHDEKLSFERPVIVAKLWFVVR